MRAPIRSIRKSFKWKMVVVNGAVIIFIVVSIGIFSYYVTSRSVKEDVVRFSSHILQQANMNLSRYYSEYELMLLSISTSEEFRQWIRVDSDDRYSSYYHFKLIKNNHIRPFIVQHPELMSLTLYNSNGNEIHYTGSVGLDMNYSLSDELASFSHVKDSRYFYAKLRDDYFMGHLRLQNVPILTMMRQLTLGEHEVYIKSDFSLYPTQNILDNINLGQGSEGLIVNEQGEIIAHSDSSKMFQKLDPEYFSLINGQSNGAYYLEEFEEMLVFEDIPSTNWKSIVIVPYQHVASSIFQVREFTIFIAIISLLISLTLVTLIATSMTRRISRMKEAIESAQQGDFEQRLDFDGHDEIAILGKAYNRMQDNLVSSIEKLTESKLMKQEAIFSALQSQIDSHFLYNTLESVSAMANLQGKNQIEETIVSLSRMLRYTSNYKDVFVPLQEEVTHLQHYIRIMKIRYGPMIRAQYDIDENCMEVLCIKAVLQPLVENSMIHGLQNNNKLILEITTERVNDQYISITIKDNGPGFDDVKLKELQVAMNEQNVEEAYKNIKKVGLLNVHYRIRMIYDDYQCGLLLANRRDQQGAIVTMLLPIVNSRRQVL